MLRNVCSVLCLICFFLLSSCQKETTFDSNAYQLVDDELWSFFQTFEDEAKMRNLNYDLNSLRISGVIEEIKEDRVAGSCQFGGHIDNHVTIDKTFWESSSLTQKEFVVFHELGHCVLLRGHDESADNQGRCLSLMRSGLSGCRDSYNSQTRTDYIDELFFNY